MNKIPGCDSFTDMSRNMDPDYVPNKRTEYDAMVIPKSENLLSVPTPDFHEFQRVFQCTRAELIHLSKYIY
jgi:hypothetical protein